MADPNNDERKETIIVSGLSEADLKDDSPLESTPKKAGRRKINIEYIEDKSRRHITFSKRKAGIMKKAYELSTLTGTQVLLLVASETGHVYTFATQKLQPLITKNEGKNLIQACLNAPDTNSQPPQPPNPSRLSHTPNPTPPPPPANNYQENPMMYPSSQGVVDGPGLAQSHYSSNNNNNDEDKKDSKDFGNMGMPDMNSYQQYGAGNMLRNPMYPQNPPPGAMNPMQQMRSGYPMQPPPQPGAGFPGYPSPQQMGMSQYPQQQSYPQPPGYPSNWPNNTPPKGQVGMPSQSHSSTQLSSIIQK